MAFETGTEMLACRACSAMHVAKWSRMPVREPIAIQCQSCGAIAHQTTTVRDYYEVTLANQQSLA